MSQARLGRLMARVLGHRKLRRSVSGCLSSLPPALMLTDDELAVLELIEELRCSSLSAEAQAPRVQRAVALIEQLDDAREEQRILGQATSNFVPLCRRKLEAAQREALANHERKLAAANARVAAPPRASASAAELVTGETPVPVEFGDANGADALRAAVHETKSAEVTEVLFRMHRMARDEIAKGEANIEELDVSSRALTALAEKYSAVDVLLNGSRQLVKVLDEADRKDRRLMLLSLGFLAAVLAYIVVRRILSGPLKLLLWTLLRLLGLAKWTSKLGLKLYGGRDAGVALTPAVSATAAAATFVATLASAALPLAAQSHSHAPAASGASRDRGTLAHVATALDAGIVQDAITHVQAAYACSVANASDVYGTGMQSTRVASADAISHTPALAAGDRHHDEL